MSLGAPKNNVHSLSDVPIPRCAAGGWAETTPGEKTYNRASTTKSCWIIELSLLVGKCFAFLAGQAGIHSNPEQGASE